MATQNLGSQRNTRAWLGGRGQQVKQAVVNGAAADTNITVTGLRPGDAIVSIMRHRDPIRVANLQLTNAQMLALRATPITAIAAPGANKAIIVHRTEFVCSSAAGAYTESADNIAVEYADGTDILVIETTGLIDQAAVGVRTQAPDFAVATPVANSAVQLKNNGDGEFGGGNAANTFSIKLWYSIVDTVAFSGTEAVWVADMASEAKITANNTLQLDTTSSAGDQLLVTWVSFAK